MSMPEAPDHSAALLSPGLHAAVRRWDHAARQEQANQLLADVTTLFLPPLLALWIPVTIALRHSVNEGEER